MQAVPDQIKTVLRPLKHSLRSMLRPIIRGSIRVQNPFASHIPVLMGLARLLPIRSVLEFGAGEYSTLMFLNRTAFPDLMRLVSFENDLAWTQKIEAMVDGDPRVDLRFTEQPVCNAARSTDTAAYDLIFIDDSLTTEERVATIQAVVGKLTGRQIATIHDYECPDYQQATLQAVARFRFDALLPNTGLVSQQLPFPSASLNRLQGVIRAHGDRVRADDIAKWACILDRKL